MDVNVDESGEDPVVFPEDEVRLTLGFPHALDQAGAAIDLDPLRDEPIAVPVVRADDESLHGDDGFCFRDHVEEKTTETERQMPAGTRHEPYGVA